MGESEVHWFLLVQNCITITTNRLHVVPEALLKHLRKRGALIHQKMRYSQTSLIWTSQNPQTSGFRIVRINMAQVYLSDSSACSQILAYWGIRISEVQIKEVGLYPSMYTLYPRLVHTRFLLLPDLLFNSISEQEYSSTGSYDQDLHLPQKRGA